jgi:MFS family permease
MDRNKTLFGRVHSTVLLLSLTSFFNDFSSEMIYPLLPVFLSTVLGAGAVALGTIEGFAEAVASILKLVSGVWADRLPRRKPLVVTGYTISSLLRPLIGIAPVWPVVLAFRIGDRVGKGIRTSPRDALIADVTDESMRGTAFGVQRAMDHAGAVAGPLVAAGLIALGLGLRSIFLFAFIPAAFVIGILVFAVKEPAIHRKTGKQLRLIADWKELGSPFHRLLLAIVFFTLGNSADAFLLLRLSYAGVSPGWVAGLWALHHLVKVGATTVGGWLSDRVGRRPLVIGGWFYYALIYLAFAFAPSTGWMIAVFILYGVYYGLTEPTEKAWVADIVPQKLRGSAYGWYNGAVGIGALPASLIFGVIWTAFSPEAAFITGAALALVASLILSTVQSRKLE